MPPSGRQNRLRTEAQEFFDFLDKSGAVIVLPTPIVTELLMGGDAADQKSAKNAADIWDAKKANGVIDQIKRSGPSMRTKLKIHIQILGVAMTQKVEAFYTQDEELAKLASGYLPTSKMPLSSQISFLQEFFSPPASDPLPLQSGDDSVEK